jgi:hypothetical protein
MTQTIFPDLEVILVALISEGLEADTDPVSSDVFVSVLKPEANLTPYPTKIVTVRSQGASSILPDVLRSEGVGVNVYAADYADANRLARVVDSVIRSSNGGYLKKIDATSSPSRVANDGREEQRYFAYNIVLKAIDYN